MYSSRFVITALYFQRFYLFLESRHCFVCLLNFSAQSLSETSEPLIARFSHGSPPAFPGFQGSQPEGYLSREKKQPSDITYNCWKNMFLILHTDCVITCMFFHGLKARGISLVYALTLTIGKNRTFSYGFDGEMLIRFEKHSLYFLQQLGKAILCCLLPWGSLRKQYENDFFFFTTSIFDACRQTQK